MRSKRLALPVAGIFLSLCGMRRTRRIALEFSRHIPAGFRQRLRNWWTISGWIRK